MGNGESAVCKKLGAVVGMSLAKDGVIYKKGIIKSKMNFFIFSSNNLVLLLSFRFNQILSICAYHFLTMMTDHIQSFDITLKKKFSAMGDQMQLV